MVSSGLFVLTTVSLAAITLSFLVSLYQWESSRLWRKRLRCYDKMRKKKRYTPRVALLVPVKGTDVGLEENLAALFRLKYPHYALVFIVESDDDPAVPIIDRLMAESSLPCRRIVAGIAHDCGQKVHNLRVATSQISPHREVLAFVDADARPHPNWLWKLVSHLEKRSFGRRKQTYGAATGYRWMVPERLSLANLMLCSANSGVAGLLGRHNFNLIWGGSWALRRKTYDEVGLHDDWQGTLTDDLVAARTLKRHGMSVYFEPGTLCVSPVDVNWLQLFEFMRRQFFLVRLYAPFHWRWALAGTTVMQVGYWLNLAATITLLATGRIEWIASAAAVMILHGLAVLRAWYRQDAARHALPKLTGKLRWVAWFDILGSPLVGAVSWLTMLGSALGNGITWREVTYRIRPGGQIEVVHRRSQPSEKSADMPTIVPFPEAGDSEARRPTPRLPEYASAAA
jgi:cellulose synthase/poly-beta-1,6-N-acetylglucosamine synthase-like glycosyltransferase